MPGARPDGLEGFTDSVTELGAPPAAVVLDNADTFSDGIAASALAGIVQFRFPWPTLTICNVCGGGAAPPCATLKTTALWLSWIAGPGGMTAADMGTTSVAPLAASRTMICP